MKEQECTAALAEVCYIFIIGRYIDKSNANTWIDC
jgi:hypothetical protein